MRAMNCIVEHRRIAKFYVTKNLEENGVAHIFHRIIFNKLLKGATIHPCHPAVRIYGPCQELHDQCGFKKFPR